MYLDTFEPNARAGVGMIIQGNSIVRAGGETAPGMICVAERETVLSLRPMTERLRDLGTRIVIQLGHGGIFALASWSRKRRREQRSPLLAPSPLPWPLRAIHPGVHVLTTAEVRELAADCGRIAGWCRDAGYDAVQLASSNAKLLHQFLTPLYNRRRDEFGGSLAGRMRVLGLIREEIARHAGDDYPVMVKIPVEDHRRGIDLDTALEMCRIAEGQGFASITPVYASHLPSTAICRGHYPGPSYERPQIQRGYLEHAESRLTYGIVRLGNRLTSRQFPFEPVWNRELFRRVRQEVSIPVLAVGGIRSRQEIDGVLGGGEADLVGIGRPFYAEPNLPERLLLGDTTPAACESCNRCVPPQMLGYKGSCYTPAIQRKRVEIAREWARRKPAEA